MYKRILTFFIAVVVLGLATFASPIKMQTARSIAVKTYLAHGGNTTDTSFSEIGREAGFSNFYIFVARNGHGFVLVSADDCARRVLAVSTTSEFVLPMPENVQGWLQGYEAKIAFLKATPSKNRGTLMQGVADPDYWTVGPLLTTEWGQSPVYNDMCPVIEENHCKAGCVATAMSQIMRYWGYPQQGTGSHSYTHESLGPISANFATTYGWANMPNTVSAASSQAEKDAVAKLVFHCGVSVDMDYGAGSSSAYSSSVPDAMNQYFGYRQSAYEDKSDYTDSEWIQMLKDEINAGRPVYYSGRGEGGGHAFVCDGYDSEDEFHFNWGWRGSYNGYFAMGNLRPKGSGTGGNSDNNYSEQNHAIFGLEPLASSLIVQTSAASLSAFGDSLNVWVRSSNQSSADWTAVSDASSWLTVNPASGAGSGTLSRLTIYATHNTTGAARTGHITVSHNGEQHTITISQPDGTLSVAGQYGNTENCGSGSGLKYGEQIVLRGETFGNFDTTHFVTAVNFRMFSTDGPFEFLIKIYEDCDFNSELNNRGYSTSPYERLGNLVYTQHYTAEGNGNQHVELSTPYRVSAGHVFWIALQSLNTRTYINYQRVPMSDSISIDLYPIYDSIDKHYVKVTTSTDGDTCMWLAYSGIRGIQVMQNSLDYLFNFTVERRYTIAALSADTSAGSVSGSGIYPDGQTATLTATTRNANRWHFDRWSDGNTDNPRTVTVSDNATYTALWSNDCTDDSVFTNQAACNTFTWFGNQYTSSGTYQHKVEGVVSTGCDSVYVLNLTVNSSNTGDTSAVACDAFFWYGQTHSASAEPQHVLTNRWNCDSTVTLHLTVNYSNTGDTSAVACDTFVWYGVNLTASGEPKRGFVNKVGCDSIVTLHLTINNSNTGDTSAVACDAFVWYGENHTASAEPQHVFTNQAGCDSTVTLHLTINNSNSGDTTAVACDAFVWYGENHTVSAEPTHVFTNHVGCDSTVTLHLTINNSNSGDTTAAECDSFAWYGETYTENAEPTHVFANHAGCDSTVTLHLTFNYSDMQHIDTMVCDMLELNGQSYTASQTGIEQMLTTVGGCDSTLTIDLTVHASSTHDTTITAEAPVEWNGQQYEADGTYTVTLVNAEGCDSLDILHLTIENVGIKDVTVETMPKIATHQGSIAVSHVEGLTVLLYDIQGRLLKRIAQAPAECRLDVAATGTYIVHITAKGQNITAQKVVVTK